MIRIRFPVNTTVKNPDPFFRTTRLSKIRIYFPDNTTVKDPDPVSGQRYSQKSRPLPRAVLKYRLPGELRCHPETLISLRTN